MTRRSALLPGLLAQALASSLLLAGSAQAHGIQSNLERLSTLAAQLESSFSTGEPASNAAVRLVPPDGAPIEVGQTDAQGRLRFRLPAEATAAWELQVDAGPGHRDYLELPSASSPAAASPAASRPVASRPMGLPIRLAAPSPVLVLGALGGVGLLGGLLRRRPRA